MRQPPPVGVLEFVARLPQTATLDAAKTTAVHVATRSQLAGSLAWGVFTVAAAHSLETALLLASWGCIGYGALSGRLDIGWLIAWALALATTVPIQAVASWAEGLLVVRIGTSLKLKLMTGALAMDPETVRRKGSAALLSEVLESSEVDELAASGGVATLLALVDVIIAVGISLATAASRLEVIVLISWVALAAAGIARTLRIQHRWTLERVHLTDDLVEKMAAHRTRLAQSQPGDWHSGEDAALDSYLTTSETLDRHAARTAAALSRGYVIAGFAALAPTFVTGGASLGTLALSLGVILFAASAFSRLSSGFTQVSAAWIAWRMLQAVITAPRRDLPPHMAAKPAPAAAAEACELTVLGLRFSHAPQSTAVLQSCDLRIAPGDQILLEGTSGCGKSTLAGILAGLRTASGGYILSGGLDRQSLGDAEWRRRVALVPQYHENHLLAGTLLFNLLLSRPAPHSEQDVAEAWEVCAELGLDGLLQRMPAGLNQFVGDTGWRLSQGERSRIYLARALLQRAGIVILDESLAALDPENLRQCLETVLRRAPTLVVIAHP